MVGSTMTTSVSPPAKIPAFRPISWMKNNIPTRPKITEGIPVRVSTAKLITLTSL